MGVFSKEIEEKQKNIGGFIKLEELLADKIQILGVEAITSRDPKYGAEPKDKLCEQGILEPGQTLRYKLKDKDGNGRFYDSKGIAFYLGIAKAAELAPGDWINVVREGKGDKTRYHIVKVK